MADKKLKRTGAMLEAPEKKDQKNFDMEEWRKEKQRTGSFVDWERSTPFEKRVITMLLSLKSQNEYIEAQISEIKTAIKELTERG